MNLATTLRFCQKPGEDIWADRYCIVQGHFQMALELGIGLNALLNDCDIAPICWQCAGLLIPGSATNIDPTYYGGAPFDPPEPADEYALDAKLIAHFLEANKPILGICGGLQAINVFLGGTLKRVPGGDEVHCRKYPTQMLRGDWIDYPMHRILIEKDSFVYDVFGTESAMVNSYHNWCIDRLAPGLQVVARSEDGIIEAVQWREKKIFATQWHPELSFLIGDPVEKQLFARFLRFCE